MYGLTEKLTTTFNPFENNKHLKNLKHAINNPITLILTTVQSQSNETYKYKERPYQSSLKCN